MSKGIVLSCEKGDEETITIALVELETKKLQLLNYEVMPMKDPANNWAMNKYPTRYSKAGLLKRNSKEIRDKLNSIFYDANIFFVRNKLTLNILTKTFEVQKSKIYVITINLKDEFGLRCVSCGDQTQTCAFYDVIAMTNLICNQDPTMLPKVTVAPAGKDFKFPAMHKFSYKTTYTIKNAEQEKCKYVDTVTEADSHESSDDDDDDE